MRTTAKVKWFDPVKGEGRVVSDGGAYASFTRAILKPHGLTAVAAETALTCEVKLTEAGLAVTAIYEIDAKPDAPRSLDVPIVDVPDQGAVRVKGTVKWFDPVKGFGFIVSKDVEGDILLHRSVVQEYGMTSILEGSEIDCDVIKKVRGHQVRRLRELLKQGTPAIPPLPAPPIPGRRWPPRVPREREILLQEPVGPAQDAECKWFSRPKGYGYVILRESGDDVFVHMDVLRKCGIRELSQYQRVLVRVGRCPKGLIATEVHLVPEGLKDERRRAAPQPAPKPERKTGLIGKLLVVNETLGFGVIALAELDDVAVADIALLRAAGALDPRTCVPLICDVDVVPPRLFIRCLTRVH